MASSRVYVVKSLLASIRAFPNHPDAPLWRREVAQCTPQERLEAAAWVEQTSADEDRTLVIEADIAFVSGFPSHPDAPAARRALAFYRQHFPQLFEEPTRV